MHYKTIVLQMIEDRPAWRNELQRQRIMLATMERYAAELKQSHEAWKTQLSQARPESIPAQIASEALELALLDLENALPSASNEAVEETLSLDEAMNFISQKPSSDG